VTQILLIIRRKQIVALLEIFWTIMTKIISRPETIEEREEFNEASTFKLKYTVKIYKLGSKLV